MSGSHFGILPTPSPEMAPSSIHHAHRASHESFTHDLPSWEVQDTVSAGSKRSHDYSLDDFGDFLADMKKRRVNPAYDSRKYFAYTPPHLC
jgi:hypothetical protein